MTSAEIRAYVLSEAAEDQRSSSVYRPGVHDEGDEWRVGSLTFWKSKAFEQKCLSADPFPAYRRGGLQMSLFPDMRFEGEAFTTKDGRRAIAILLRSEKNPQGTFGTFALDEGEADRIITLLNSEMDATRAIAMERFRASGGDPAAVASQLAPSSEEMFAVFEALLGTEDER